MNAYGNHGAGAAGPGQQRNTGGSHWWPQMKMPATQPGRWAFRLWVVSAAFLAAFFGFVAAGERGGDTFFSGSPWLYLTILPMFATGIAGGFAAAWAVFKRAERSVLVFASLFWGAFWLFFGAGEIAFPH